MADERTNEEVRTSVRAHYASAVRQVLRLKEGSGVAAGCCSGVATASTDCCGPAACSCDGAARFYNLEMLRELPEEAVLASMGCGNPLLLAELKPGEVVLDLGSGGGIDVLLSARRVGPTGKAYGLDMTDEMLELARENARRAGVTNVEFLKGHIEEIPLPDESVDVIISNCVINLSPDKDAVLAEAYRVLRPGGRFAVADVVVLGKPLSDEVRRLLDLWAGCLSGAITDSEYRAKLAVAGFTGIEVQVLKESGPEDLPEELRCSAPAGLLGPGSRITASLVKAVKPA